MDPLYKGHSIQCPHCGRAIFRFHLKNLHPKHLPQLSERRIKTCTKCGYKWKVSVFAVFDETNPRRMKVYMSFHHVLKRRKKSVKAKSKG